MPRTAAFPLALLGLVAALALTAGATGGVAATAQSLDHQDADGVVYRYYAGYGMRFQPLLSFAHLNELVSAHQVSPARRLVRALLARGVRHGDALYWHYDFPYGGPAPWDSGFAQAVAAQSLARASLLLDDPSLLAPAGAAFQGLKETLLLPVTGGVWIQEYGFSQQVILNSQLQSVLSLESYARIVRTPEAARLVASLYQASRRLLPRFDLGCRSLYQLGGPVADAHYQAYHVELLRQLALKHPDPIWQRTHDRWARCL